MVTGATGKVSHVPLPMMRAMAVAMKRVNPAMAGLIEAGIVHGYEGHDRRSVGDATALPLDRADAHRGCHPNGLQARNGPRASSTRAEP
jgi:hypothetical protein